MGRNIIRKVLPYITVYGFMAAIGNLIFFVPLQSVVLTSIGIGNNCIKFNCILLVISFLYVISWRSILKDEFNSIFPQLSKCHNYSAVIGVFCLIGLPLLGIFIMTMFFAIAYAIVLIVIVPILILIGLYRQSSVLIKKGELAFDAVSFVFATIAPPVVILIFCKDLLTWKT